MSVGAFLGEGISALWRERFYDHARLQRLQQRRLSALVRHAADGAPLYRALYAGVDPDRFVLDQLPTISKELLLERFTDSVVGDRVPLDEAQRYAAEKRDARGLFRDRYLLATTSGTTGQVGYFLFDRQGWARQLGLLFARLLRERLAPRHLFRFFPWRRFRMAFLVATGGPYITYLVSGFDSAALQLVAKISAFSISEVLAQTVAALNAFQPHFVHGYATFVEALAHEQRAGALAICPEIISLGSEPLTPLGRRTIEAAFPDVCLREGYGATECVALACGCRAGQLHVNIDACVLEPVDRAGLPVPPGELSDHAYLTNLLGYAQPLIRYRLADQIRVLEGPCACGSPLPAIEVAGRSDDTFYLRDPAGATSAHPPIPFELLFLEVPGIKQYQLVHSRQNQLSVRFIPDREGREQEITAHLGQAFGDYLRRHGLERCVEVSVDAVPHLERDARSQKLRQIVSEVPAPSLELPGADGEGA